MKPSHARRSERRYVINPRIKHAGLALIALGCVTTLVQHERLEYGDTRPPRHDLQLVRNSSFRSNGNAQSTNEPRGSVDDMTDVSTSDPCTRIDVQSVVNESQNQVSVVPIATTEAPPVSEVPTPSITQTRMTHSDRIARTRPSVPPLPSTTPTATETPLPLATKVTEAPTSLRVHDDCYYERDVGVIERVSTPSHVFCENFTNATQTQVTLMDVPGGVRATRFQNMILDLTNTVVNRPIASMAQEGGDHDPRFRFTSHMIYCACDAFQNFSSNPHERTWNVWDHTFGYHTYKYDVLDPSLVCSGPNAAQFTELVTSKDQLVEIPGKVMLLARRDDHNPFFQVSGALNAWIMLQALQWNPRDVTLIHLDGGYPSPIDELHHHLLSPGRDLLDGKKFKGTRLWFSGEVLLPPFESDGPMMQHLDDHEPCMQSQLFQTFRDQSLYALGAVHSSSLDHIVVTVISRRPFKGRFVQRVWLNEADILAQLQTEYTTFQNKTIVFQSIEFSGLELTTQMQLMLQSDVVIGMHGAGMVNVLWTRPGTLVIEIFPRKRRRWGYRNLCQFIGCEWHEFRGGMDVRRGWSTDANTNDKNISYDEWHAFFDPLFRNHVAKIGNRTRS